MVLSVCFDVTVVELDKSTQTQLHTDPLAMLPDGAVIPCY